MGLGMKISKAFSTLGRKANNTVNMLGDKAQNVLKQVDNKVSGAINSVDKFADNTINKANNVAQNLVNKSGVATNILRKVATVGDKVLSFANRAGLADVPGIGLLSTVAEAGTGALRKTAVGLDKKRDNLAEKIGSKTNALKLEKDNLRKQTESALSDAVSNVSSFV
jgi:ElaB/YqjD/DUF883 family membrane-anchored ribosome-binding protein